MVLYELESGRLLNELQVVRGALPEARFGREGEVILRNLGTDRGQVGVTHESGWFRPEVDPVAAIPVDPGALSLDELGRWLPIGGEPAEGVVPALRANAALAAGLNVWKGRIVHPGVASSIGESPVPLEAALAS